LIAGSCATKDYKPRQVRKEAAVVIPFVCRRGAWLSTGYQQEKIEADCRSLIVWSSYFVAYGERRYILLSISEKVEATGL